MEVEVNLNSVRDLQSNGVPHLGLLPGEHLRLIAAYVSGLRRPELKPA